jgi:aspartate racemase
MHPIRFGIIGNMGPEADELFQRHLRLAMGGRRDQDALPQIVVKNPAIPDRTEAIAGRGPSPVDEMLASCRLLEACDVRFAVMPCNTAHYFLPELQRQTSVFLVDMLAVTSEHLHTHHAGTPIGLLATHGTVQSGLYQGYASQYGPSLLTLPQDLQETCVHAAIYGSLMEPPDALPGGGRQGLRQANGLKSGCYGLPVRELTQALHFMQSQGAATVILGCTELPLVQKPLQKRFPAMTFVDPMEITAAHVCRLYKDAVHWRAAHPDAATVIQNPRQIKTRQEIIEYIAGKQSM